MIVAVILVSLKQIFFVQIINVDVDQDKINKLDKIVTHTHMLNLNCYRAGVKQNFIERVLIWLIHGHNGKT